MTYSTIFYCDCTNFRRQKSKVKNASCNTQSYSIRLPTKRLMLEVTTHPGNIHFMLYNQRRIAMYSQYTGSFDSIKHTLKIHPWNVYYIQHTSCDFTKICYMVVLFLSSISISVGSIIDLFYLFWSSYKHRPLLVPATSHKRKCNMMVMSRVIP